MATKNEVGDVLMDEILNTLKSLRENTSGATGVDAIRADDLLKVSQAYAAVGEHFAYKKS